MPSENLRKRRKKEPLSFRFYEDNSEIVLYLEVTLTDG